MTEDDQGWKLAEEFSRDFAIWYDTYGDHLSPEEGRRQLGRIWRDKRVRFQLEVCENERQARLGNRAWRVHRLREWGKRFVTYAVPLIALVVALVK